MRGVTDMAQNTTKWAQMGALAMARIWGSMQLDTDRACRPSGSRRAGRKRRARGGHGSCHERGDHQLHGTRRLHGAQP